MRALTACDRGAGHCGQRRRLLLLLLLRAWEHTAALAGTGQAVLPGHCAHPLLQGGPQSAGSMRMRCAIGRSSHAGKGAMGWLALLATRRLRALHLSALAGQWRTSMGQSASPLWCS